MANFGEVSQQLAQDPQLRWLGPHKGVVHLALASLTNACFDLWAKARGLPLWRLLLDLDPQEVVNLLDLSYLNMSSHGQKRSRSFRNKLRTAPRGKQYCSADIPDTTPRWDGSITKMQVKDLAQRALQRGFSGVQIESRVTRRGA